MCAAQSPLSFAPVKNDRPDGLIAPSGFSTSALLGQRVVLMHKLLQPFFEDVRIDLRRRNISVAQQLLHGSQICPSI